MGILCKNGKFFNKRLMQHIKQRNNDEVLSILQNVDPCQLTNSLGNTLLHYAAKYGNNEFAQHLIDLGAAVDARNQRHRTPLFFAVDGGQEDTATLLVEANADMFVSDVSGQCPLIRAFQYRPNIATALLRALTVDSLKKNVEHVKSEKFRPYLGLHQFMLLKNVEITRFLLENGSPVNDKSPENEDTALHLAAEQLDLEMVKLLLEFNADVNAKGLDGKTPVGRILIKTDEEHDKALAIVKVLVADGAVLIDRESGEPMVRNLLSSGNRVIIRFLLRDHIDLQCTKEYKWWYLYDLALNKQPDVLAEVPNLESFVTFRNFRGATMLTMAAFCRNVSAVKHLLDSGADVNAEDRLGKTPLDFLMMHYARFEIYDDIFYEILDCTEMLLERGARPRLTVEFQMTSNCTPYTINDKYLPIIEPVYVYLAVHEASGEAIDRISHDDMELYRQCKAIYDSARREIDELKRMKIWQSVTLIDFLYESDRQFVSYARIEGLVVRLPEAMKGCNSDSYLHRKLRQRLEKFIHLVEVRAKLVTIISDGFKEFYDISVKTVAENIVDYLTTQELDKIAMVCE